MAWPDPEETYGFKTDFDYGFIEKVLTRAVDRVPCVCRRRGESPPLLGGDL